MRMNTFFSHIVTNLKAGLSPSEKKLFYLLQWKNDEKCFFVSP